MSTIRMRSVAALASVALILTPALASCGQVAEKAAEQAAEQAIGGDVDVTDGGVTVTDEDGNQMAAGENVTIPDNWPAEVPVYDGGTLQVVTVQADGSASAMWATDGTPQEAATAYAEALTSAGFTEDSTSNMGGMIVNMYTGNGFEVSLNALDADGTTNLMVTVQKSA
jgi:hypothetical protein